MPLKHKSPRSSRGRAAKEERMNRKERDKMLWKEYIKYLFDPFRCSPGTVLSYDEFVERYFKEGVDGAGEPSSL